MPRILGILPLPLPSLSISLADYPMALKLQDLIDYAEKDKLSLVSRHDAIHPSSVTDPTCPTQKPPMLPCARTTPNEACLT